LGTRSEIKKLADNVNSERPFRCPTFKTGSQKKERLYELQSDIADYHDYDSDYDQPDNRFYDDVKYMEPTAKNKHREKQTADPPTEQQKED
jgi:hypothetical protein